MKSIIKLSIFALLIAVTSESLAQTFGVKGGVNFSNMLLTESELFVPYNTSVAEPRMNIGFHIGGVIEYPITRLFSLESGLFLTTLGTKLTTEEPFGATTLITKSKHNLYYLNIPLAVKVPFSIKGLGFYASAGGYAGMGLIGSADTISTFGELEETTDGKIAWGTEQGIDNLKRFDYGLTFGAGMKYKSYQIGAFYNLGLANISSDSEIGSVAKNRVLGISVGYSFGGGKSPDQAKQKTEESKVQPAKSGQKESEKEKRQRLEKMRADSVVAAWAHEETIRTSKARADSIEAARVMAAKIETERINKEKIKADSIAEAQKAAAVLMVEKDVVIYRVQFASNTTKKGSYNVTIGGKNYNTWEYSYSGAFRSTVGEFKTLADATGFQKIVRQSGHPQAFVVAFKNNVRSTDPALFK